MGQAGDDFSRLRDGTCLHTDFVGAVGFVDGDGFIFYADVVVMFLRVRLIRNI